MNTIDAIAEMWAVKVDGQIIPESITPSPADLHRWLAANVNDLVEGKRSTVAKVRLIGHFRKRLGNGEELTSDRRRASMPKVTADEVMAWLKANGISAGLHQQDGHELILAYVR
jgi:hypothetical protein